MEIITAILAAFEIWYLTQISNRKNKKIEEIAESIRVKFNDVFKENITKNKKAEYLYALKYIYIIKLKY